MQGKWLRIIEASGDEPIGSALVRLARQATAIHLYAAERGGGDGAGSAGGDRLDERTEQQAAAAEQQAAREVGR